MDQSEKPKNYTDAGNHHSSMFLLKLKLMFKMNFKGFAHTRIQSERKTYYVE